MSDKLKPCYICHKTNTAVIGEIATGHYVVCGKENGGCGSGVIAALLVVAKVVM